MSEGTVWPCFSRKQIPFVTTLVVPEKLVFEAVFLCAYFGTQTLCSAIKKYFVVISGV